MIIQDEPHYYYWKHEIPADICDAIVDIGDGLKKEAGSLEAEGFQDLNMRDSKISWIEDRWITTMLHSYVTLANREMWNYDIFPDQELSACQYTTYDRNGHYGWHADTINIPMVASKDPEKDDLSSGRVVRKLSVTLQLTDNLQYGGGDFEMVSTNGVPVKIEDKLKSKGTIFVFPSFLMHRVTPVTTGIRRSLVNWYVGPPFR